MIKITNAREFIKFVKQGHGYNGDIRKFATHEGNIVCMECARKRRAFLIHSIVFDIDPIVLIISDYDAYAVECCFCGEE